MKSSLIVLLVDDDLEDQEIFAATLSSINKSIRCLHASNGKQALTILMESSRLPDYIFLDLNMPIMNGCEFLKEIKSYEQLSKIPLHIYTTSSEKKHREEALRLGASDFITKPSNLKELAHRLKIIFSIN